MSSSPILPPTPDSTPGSLPETSPGSLAWTNRRIIWVAAMVVLVAALIWRAPEEAHYFSEHAGEILVTLVIAMSITYLLRPMVNALQKFPVFGGKTPEARHRGRGLAVIFVFICIGLAFYLLILVGLNPITRDAAEMWRRFVPDDPLERSRFFADLSAKVQGAINEHLSWAGPQFNNQLQEGVTGAVNAGVEWLKSSVGRVFKGVGFIVELLLIPVLVFYFLCDGPAIRAEARLLVPAEWRPRAARMAAHLDRVFDGYIRGQALMCIIAWILVTLMLLALGVRYPFTLGIIAGLTRAVPVIGPLLGAVPLALVCFLTTNSVSTTSLLLLGFTLMHFLESKVLLPRVIGHEVDLHPVTVIIALLMGMEFFGFLGVFLAVPLAAILKIVLAEWHAGRQMPILTPATPDFQTTLSENGVSVGSVKEKL